MLGPEHRGDIDIVLGTVVVLGRRECRLRGRVNAGSSPVFAEGDLYMKTEGFSQRLRSTSAHLRERCILRWVDAIAVSWTEVVLTHEPGTVRQDETILWVKRIFTQPRCPGSIVIGGVSVTTLSTGCAKATASKRANDEGYIHL